MKWCVFILVNFIYSYSIFSKQITGIVVDEQNIPIEYANVTLFNYNDSSFLMATVTATDGTFSLEIANDMSLYFLEISYLGYKTDTLKNINANVATQLSLGTIQLQIDNQILNGVEITALKPILERKPDRLIFNVENSSKAAGENALDLMRTIPGVTINGNNQINVNGKTNIQVMINDKIEQVSPDQLQNLLKSLQSSNIKKIEVISNPSAKYDAAAKGGIINIVLKSNLKTGWNGSTYISYRQHKKPCTDIGFNINVGHKKIVVAANYNYSYNNNFNETKFIRNFTNQTNTQQYNELGYGTGKFKAHFLNTSLTYNLNDNHQLGISTELFQFTNPNLGTSILTIYDTLSNATISSYQTTYNNTDAHSINPSAHLYYKATLDSGNSSILFNYDYTYFNQFTEGHLVTSFFNLDNQSTNTPYDFTQSNPYIVNLHTSKLDYSKSIKNDNSLELGVKLTWTKTFNDVVFNNLIGSQYITDTTKSNKFEYKENINAVYGIWNKKWKNDWSTNLGLRVEQTNTNQYSITLNNRTKRNYVGFFPSVFIQKDINENHSVNLNFSRKIVRPNFNDLNPFQFYLSPYAIWTGNAQLQPQNINVTEFTYTLKNTYTFFVGHENIHNNYTHLVFQDDSTKISTYKATNFKVRNNLNIGVSVNKELFNWWSLSFSAQYTYFKYNSVVNNSSFNVYSNKGDFSLDNTFILPKDFKINLFCFFTTPHLDATDIMLPDGMVNIAISKSFFDKAFLIRLAGNDIFHTNNFSYNTNFFNVDSKTRNKFSSQFISLTLTYNFQKGKEVQDSQIKSGNEEEKSRIG